MPDISRARTRLVVTIEEDVDGNLNVWHIATNAETGEKIGMRPTHVIGQLGGAQIIIALDNYGSIKAAAAAATGPGPDAEAKKT